MKPRTLSRLAVAGVFVTLQLSSVGAHAQLMDNLKGKLNGLQGGGSSSGASSGSSLGGMSLSSLSSGSSSNVAGVLEFCAKNNYLDGQDATSVKDKLMDKISGKKKTTPDKNYLDGAKGILMGQNGTRTELGGSGTTGLKEQITKKACDQILKQGKSLI